MWSVVLHDYKNAEELLDKIMDNDACGGNSRSTPGPTHRIRRRKEVEIPEQWRGKVTRPQTIRKRQSKKGMGQSFRSKKIR